MASSKKTEIYDGENIILEIKNADSEEDAGDYKCVASNNYGTVSHGARITVDVEHVLVEIFIITVFSQAFLVVDM